LLREIAWLFPPGSELLALKEESTLGEEESKDSLSPRVDSFSPRGFPWEKEARDF